MSHRQQGSAAMVVLVIVLLAVLGVGFWWVWDRNRDKTTDDSDNQEPASLTIKDVGFMTPESVAYDAAADVYLVSNINGTPLAKDDNGFISRVSPDGQVLELKWIDGAADDVTLHAPKGLAVHQDELFVADIDTVRVFSRESGRLLREVSVEGATFLNDVAVNSDGVAFVSDSGMDANFESTATDAIHKITGETVETLVADTGLSRPNGIALHSDGQQMMVVSFGSSKVFHVNADGTFKTTAELPEGSLDGIVWETVDQTMLVTSWDGKNIYRVAHDSGQSSLAFENMTAPADSGFDTKRNRILVPLFNDNTVEVRRVN